MNNQALKVEIIRLPATEQQVTEIIESIKRKLGDACSEPTIVSAHERPDLGNDGLYLNYQIDLLIYDTQRYGCYSIIRLLHDMGHHPDRVKERLVPAS